MFESHLPLGQCRIRLAGTNKCVFTKTGNANHEVEARSNNVGSEQFVWELRHGQVGQLFVHPFFNVVREQVLGARNNNQNMHGQRNRETTFRGKSHFDACDGHFVMCFPDVGETKHVTTTMVQENFIGGEMVERLTWTEDEADAKKMIFESIDE